MLSKKTEQNLIELFIAISTGEEKINQLKQNIITNYNINPIQLFFKLDINNKGHLSKNDISSYLKFYSINFTYTDIDYIFYFYDKDNDNFLNFYEFLNLIISDSNYLYKKLFKKKYRNNKIDENEINADIDKNIEKSILKIFQEEIDFARNLKELILNLKKNSDFMIQNAFYEIKSYSYITNDSLKAFFDRNEVTYNDKFIKNIFSRFDTKETSGKISFNKFKIFCDLPYNSHKVNKNNTIIENPYPPQSMSQTFKSGDIKISNSDINFGSTNINQEMPKEGNINNYKPNLININNENFINEEDIQFECSHLSRSGSVEYIKEKDNNNNCNYVPNNEERNNLYKNYLREKRSKSLEKSLSKSLSRTSEAISRTEKRNAFEKNEINIRNIRPIYDNYNDNYNSNNSMDSGSGRFLNEDLPVKMPIRLDKNLVKRNPPKRKISNSMIHHHHNSNNKVMHNFYYDNNYEDLNMNNQTNYNIENDQYYQGNQHYNNYQNNFSDNYYEQEMSTYENVENNYNDRRGFKGGKFDDSRININDLDLKVYQEDMSSSINNGRY